MPHRRASRPSRRRLRRRPAARDVPKDCAALSRYARLRLGGFQGRVRVPSPAWHPAVAARHLRLHAPSLLPRTLPKTPPPRSATTTRHPQTSMISSSPRTRPHSLAHSPSLLPPPPPPPHLVHHHSHSSHSSHLQPHTPSQRLHFSLHFSHTTHFSSQPPLCPLHSPHSPLPFSLPHPPQLARNHRHYYSRSSLPKIASCRLPSPPPRNKYLSLSLLLDFEYLLLSLLLDFEYLILSLLLDFE